MGIDADDREGGVDGEEDVVARVGVERDEMVLWLKANTGWGPEGDNATKLLGSTTYGTWRARAAPTGLDTSSLWGCECVGQSSR